MKLSAKKEIEAWVPLMFWLDHCERFPLEGIANEKTAHELRVSGSRALISGTKRQIDALRNDAQFYVDPYGPNELPAGLKRSAAATLKALAGISKSFCK